MDSEIFLYLRDISIEKIIISICVFLFTMLIKWPIKKATASLPENRRKAINTIIIFIPMVLSLIFNILYFGILKESWFETKVFESAGSCYLFAVLIYSIYSRLVFIIKGIKPEKENDLTKESIDFIKGNIKTISSSLKIDEKELENVTSKIEQLLKIREKININLNDMNIEALKNLDINIESLMSQKMKIQDLLESKKYELSINEKAIEKN